MLVPATDSQGGGRPGPETLVTRSHRVLRLTPCVAPALGAGAGSGADACVRARA
ncbi:hypothetical protein HMPREF1486_04544 [Streptomyces sp. HPH0547]|nr:hypothetical protein HMPREF1486_04544 [Streptomyces sp. HPH0547]